MLSMVINIAGLGFATIGGIGAALCAPSPQYHADGSVSLIGEPDREKRIAMHRRQKLIKPLLAMVGIGAFMQLVGLLIG